jgi:hypothetical protein
MTMTERHAAHPAHRYPTRARRRAAPLLAGMLLALFTRRAHAEGKEAKEHGGDQIERTIIVGVGGAAELELRDGSLHPGANLMVEWDAIENWLEFEVEASVLSADGGVEVPLGLLIKKPFRLARWAEFMIGVGPELVRVSNPSTKATYGGAQFALDFMFWPSQHVGLWVEPSYDLIFRNAVSHGIGSTGGLLLGW